MRRIVEAIMDDNYVSADELFRESMGELVEHFILESKKIVASQMVEEKENDHDRDDPPFDPDKKKSTPWKNPHSKAKHLAREMMKKYKKKEDLKEEQLDELNGDTLRHYLERNALSHLENDEKKDMSVKSAVANYKKADDTKDEKEKKSLIKLGNKDADAAHRYSRKVHNRTLGKAKAQSRLSGSYNPKKSYGLKEAHSLQQLKQAKAFHKQIDQDYDIPGNSEEEYKHQMRHKRAAKVAGELIKRHKYPEMGKKKWTSFKKY